MSPKLSVCITTYNHGVYIAQALDSVLAQKTDFEFEIIVGEDDSEDNTRELVKDYAERFPDRIRILLNDRENVIYINHRPTGRWNFINNLKHARGEYIALLEGDDYWTDELKLQKQVNFLDGHPDYSMCFTNAQIWNEDESQFDSNLFCETHAQTGLKQIVQFNDMATSHWVPTGSVVFRQSCFNKFPAWFYVIPMADWGLVLLLLDKGPGRYLEECTSVYRIHNTSYWSSLPYEVRLEGGYQFLQVARNKFGLKKGVAMNQVYYLLSSEKYQNKSGLRNKFKWFYNKLMQKFWRVFKLEL